jgi:hypothetical protein
LQAFSDNTAIDLVHSDARLIDGHGLVLSGTLLDRLRVGGEARAALAGGASFAPLMRRNLVTGATVAIRSSLLERALPFPTSWLHDEWLAAIAASSRGTRLIDRALIDYRLHEDNEVGAERITAAVRLSRLTSDRSARNARLLARARDLAERLPDGSSKNIAQAKLQHETVRSGYPAGRLRRAPAVVRELATGRYSRFGRGVEDVVRDLVQPARSDR